jgi:hypothetical protein
MTRNDNPLPKPQNSAIRRKSKYEQPDENATLLADRMAAAMVEGKLDEFIRHEMPDNEYARNLASMMMGMTGMLPMEGEPIAASPLDKPLQTDACPQTEEISPSPEVPAQVLEDVRKAIEGGDVQNLMELLRKEHIKRTPSSETVPTEETNEASSTAQPSIDKEQIDALLQIANDNSVSVDWLILRAIKVYVQEYRKTGRL